MITKVQATIKEGDILVANWGYEANNVNFFKVLKRTKHFVTIAELDSVVADNNPGVWNGVTLMPGTTWKSWSQWADPDGQIIRKDDGSPIDFRRKVLGTSDGYEYALFTSYANMYLWNGEPQLDYNWH
jgi:hypothetical protein